MTGVDTFYENVAILELQLDACVCKKGMNPTMCAQLCDGTYQLDCPSGYIEKYNTELGWRECVVSYVAESNPQPSAAIRAP